MKDNKITMVQQGDVLLKIITDLPSGEKKIISKGKITLAEGEATGHSHTIEEEDSQLIQIGDRIILDLRGKSTIIHQEHKSIDLENGLWEVGKVQEYDYFSKMKRPVMD